ncbi:MAG TPA: FAD-dependent oxidoreductase [Pseudonocardiaceae bacterium]
MAAIAVIGGGIVGCLVARQIVEQQPGSTVTLLDRDAVGCGASRRSAGLHFPRGATDRVRRMSEFSEAFYRELAGLPIYPIGMSVLTRADDDQIERTYCHRTHRDESTTVNAGGTSIPVAPDVSMWDVDGAQHADVARLVAALAADLRPRADVREGVGVTGLEPYDRGVRIELGTGDQLTVDRVVLAPGPWLYAPAWAKWVAPLGARVKKIVSIHIERPVRPDDRAIVLHDEDAFLLPLAYRGHWLFSYTCPDWDVDPDLVGSGLNSRDVQRARECLGRYAPELVAAAASGRVFCDAYSIDATPVARALDTDRRLVFAGAANGSGYRLAPAIAAEALRAFEPSGKGIF